MGLLVQLVLGVVLSVPLSILGVAVAHSLGAGGDAFFWGPAAGSFVAFFLASSLYYRHIRKKARMRRI